MIKPKRLNRIKNKNEGKQINRISEKGELNGNSRGRLHNTLPSLLSTNQNFTNKNSINELPSRETQQEEIEKTYQRLELSSFSSFLSLPKTKIEKNFGMKKGQLKRILKKEYPNYPWATLPIHNKNDIDKQREFMEDLFVKLKLKSMDEWMRVTRDKIRRNGGDWLVKYYKNEMKDLLSSIYPFHCWQFSSLKKQMKISSVDDHRIKFDQLFIKLNLKTLDDWLAIPKMKISQSGGNALISLYRGNLFHLLHTLYPNFPWEISFSITRPSKLILKSLENQRKFMDHLFTKFNLKSLDDWLKGEDNRIKSFIKRSSLVRRYGGDFKLLLSSVYPNYPWKNLFSLEKRKLIKKLKRNLNLDPRQRKMEFLFWKFKLKTLDDWLFVPQSKFTRYGGGKLLEKFRYHFPSLLSSLFPHFPWDFSIHLKKRKFQSIENQRKRMDHIYHKLNLNSLDDWSKVSTTKMIQYGGSEILSFYRGNLNELFQSIYPHFVFDFSKRKITSAHFSSIVNQQSFLDHLFSKFNFKTLDDWLPVSNKKLIQNRGKVLLKKYKYNKKLLLLSLYPNYPWQFQYRDYLLPKIKEWIDKYNIKQKKDWYRVPMESNLKYELYNTLIEFYPNEQWEKSNFILRTKKTTQRLLFSFTQKIYPSLLIFENYFHPKIISSENVHYELDIFIPALQIAMEYQGEHHYDDIPGGFAGIELFQERDVEKEKLASSLHIKIIYIPYWWDLSLSSLQTSLQSQLLI